ncbi:hypothetical protein RKE38_12815 [Phycicoccus sp. M110.8]|uniref:hypothetical protein n=1 Tax=Phycicoccus sp. M110.8 TaxID=3075433 RepID=UPI0028FD6414|nr:hypothetical protein [Phycicoccus sp. M110.8]MDU0314574.1 hypothetical protein [Phycicoccus sp. M110.8]
MTAPDRDALGRDEADHAGGAASPRHASGAEELPSAVLAEAQAPLPDSVTAYHRALLEAAQAHDVIRMDHLVFGWSQARGVLRPEGPEELSQWAVLDRRLGQVLLGAGHPAAGQVLAESIEAAAAAGDMLEEIRSRMAFVPVELGVGDEQALQRGLGYVEQLLAMDEPGHAAGGLMGLAHVAPEEMAPTLLLRASHFYEQDGDGGWAAEAATLAVRAMVAVDDPRTDDTLARARALVDAHPTVELRISLAELEALVLWRGGDPETATVLLQEAIGAAERTGRPVPPDLRILLCDILVESGRFEGLREPAQALVGFARMVEDDELASMGERYLALAPEGGS